MGFIWFYRLFPGFCHVFLKFFSKTSSFFQGFALFSKRKFNVKYIYSGQRWMVLLLDAASKIVK